MGEYHYLSCHPHRGQQIPALDQGGSGDKQTGARRRWTGTREPTRTLTPGAASRRGRQAAGGVTHLSKRTGWSRLHNISWCRRVTHAIFLTLLWKAEAPSKHFKKVRQTKKKPSLNKRETMKNNEIMNIIQLWSLSAGLCVTAWYD